VTRTTVDVLTLALVAVAALVAMRVGWTRRAGRWSDVGADLVTTAPTGATAVFGPVDATYLATTPVDAPLERIPVRGLGVRAPAAVAVDDGGVLVTRAGSGDLYLPADRLVDAGPADGIAGTAVGRGRLVLIRWRSGAPLLQTGLLPRHDDDRAGLTEAVNRVATRKEPT
jgi:hypothetical protein